MKKILFFLAICLVSQVLKAQTTVTNPRHGFSTAPNVKILKIELTDSNTIMSFHVDYPSGQWIFIPNKTYIQESENSEKLFITKAEGIPMSKRYTMPESGEVDYSLLFPALDKTIEKINYGEDNNGGSWYIYDICINCKPLPSVIPGNLLGTWYSSNGSQELQLALYEQTAVFKSAVWNYGKVSNENDLYQIELKNETDKVTLFIEPSDSSNCKIGETVNELVPLCNNPVTGENYQSAEEPYSLPVFKNDSARFSGYIRDYIPRKGKNTGSVYVNNVIIGNQETYVLKIDESGYFSVAIPMAYPEQVFLQVPMLPRTVFLEPGKETFILCDWALQPSALFMGEMAGINKGLAMTEKIRYYDYQKVRDEILDMTPKAFKAYCLEIQDKELTALEDLQKEHYLSPKAVQVKKMDIKYSALGNALSYDMNCRSVVRKKEKEDTTGQTKIEIPEIDANYFDFLTNEIVNDPLAVLSSNFSSFINRLMYLDLFRDKSNSEITTLDIADYLLQNGTDLNPEELNLIEALKANENPKSSEKNKAFNFKYGNVVQNFVQKYNAEILELTKQTDFVLWYDIEAALNKKGIELSKEEKELLVEAQNLVTREESLKQIKDINPDVIQAFYSKHQAVTSAIFNARRKAYREEVLTTKMKIDLGLTTDIMYSQEQCRSIVEELTPVSCKELIAIQKNINTPFIADYIGEKNKETKQKIEASKLKTGYVVNETPTVESEKLFDAMMEKFRGKVVFVDFWATWCSPCRSGIERMKPIREEYEGKDIVFVFITNGTSPEGSWKNMIADMKGEHFRLSQDDWNILSARFGISGIPHYVLVDKKGVVANNNNLPQMNVEAMKKLFDEFIAK